MTRGCRPLPKHGNAIAANFLSQFLHIAAYDVGLSLYGLLLAAHACAAVQIVLPSLQVTRTRDS